MNEGFRPKPIETARTPEALVGEVVSLKDQVDLLKDLVSISGSLTASILRNIFKLN